MQSAPLFAALLTPHRSMNGAGIRRVIAFTALLAAIPGLVFFVLGAWPVIGFLGLEVLLLYWALSASLGSGKAFEEVTLWPDALDIRQVSGRGKETTHSVNPFYARLRVVRDSAERVTTLLIVTRGTAIEIGGYLNAEDKARFAQVFGAALHKARA